MEPGRHPRCVWQLVRHCLGASGILQYQPDFTTTACLARMLLARTTGTHYWHARAAQLQAYAPRSPSRPSPPHIYIHMGTSVTWHLPLSHLHANTNTNTYELIQKGTTHTADTNTHPRHATQIYIPDIYACNTNTPTHTHIHSTQTQA